MPAPTLGTAATPAALVPSRLPSNPQIGGAAIALNTGTTIAGDDIHFCRERCRHKGVRSDRHLPRWCAQEYAARTQPFSAVTPSGAIPMKLPCIQTKLTLLNRIPRCAQHTAAPLEVMARPRMVVTFAAGPTTDRAAALPMFAASISMRSCALLPPVRQAACSVRCRVGNSRRWSATA